MIRCQICKRELTDPASIERGMGDICAAHAYQDSDEAGRDDFADIFDETSFREAFVMKRADGKAITNVPHLVVHHSPTGFEFGYGGSGAADLALNACQLYLNSVDYAGAKTKCYEGRCWTLAWMLHQDFKSYFIAKAPKRGERIAFQDIDMWMRKTITFDLLARCATAEELIEE